MQTVFTYEPGMRALSIHKSEIYRYLGYTAGADVPENITSMVEEILENVLSGSRPLVCYKQFDLDFDDGIDFGYE